MINASCSRGRRTVNARHRAPDAILSAQYLRSLKAMPELPQADARSGAEPQPIFKPSTPMGRALLLYRWILNGIVTALVVVMVLALLGALFGLILDFTSAASAFKAVRANHALAQGIVYATDREVVI